MPPGRPTIMDDATIQKLEEAFAMGCSDNEACLYADIGKSTLYNYQNDNPDFLERKNILKDNPVLQARSTVLEKLKDDGRLAMDFLKNKKSDEFFTHEKREEKKVEITASLEDLMKLMDTPEGREKVEQLALGKVEE